MRFKKVYGFKLMKVGKTQNTLELDEDIIEESVFHHVFDITHPLNKTVINS